MQRQVQHVPRPDEISNTQALPLTPERTGRAFIGKIDKDVLGQLVVPNNLVQLTRPTAKLASVITPKDEIASLFNTEIDYTSVYIGSLSISRLITELSAVTTAAQTANDIIPVIQAPNQRVQGDHTVRQHGRDPVRLAVHVFFGPGGDGLRHP